LNHQIEVQVSGASQHWTPKLKITCTNVVRSWRMDNSKHRFRPTRSFVPVGILP